MKSTATYLLLLCWPVMLCLSVLLKESKTAIADIILRASISREKLVRGQQQHPVAWLEQMPEQSAATDFNKATPLSLPASLLPLYNAGARAGKPPKPKRSFSSLASRFRILPNAP